MCRYAAHAYKRHYAYFACRKAFKRRNKRDVDSSLDEHPARCPQCGLLMANMGLDFAPPKMSDRHVPRNAAAPHFHPRVSRESTSQGRPSS
jgi:hypothetical protein